MNVTLVVPVRNEEKSFEELWKSIQAQVFQPAQIILVDGGSSDNTINVIHRLTVNDSRVLLLLADNAMPGQARNIGIKAATFEWVALTDCGIRLDVNWLSQLVKVAHSDASIEVVYGNYDPQITSFFEECAAIAYVPNKWSADLTAGQSIRAPFIASSLLKKSLWERVGGFPHWRAAEDLIFIEKVKQINAKTAYAPEALVNWQLRPTLNKTIRKFCTYSAHNVWAGMQKHWHYGILKHYLVYALLIVGCIHLSSTHKPIRYGVVFVIPVIGYLCRTLKNLIVKQDLYSITRKHFYFDLPVRVVMVLSILIAIDLAMFAGWVYALIKKSDQ